MKTCPSEGIRDLEPMGLPAALFSSVLRPLVAAPSEERLHLLALDGTAGQVAYLALDATGKPASPSMALPLATAEAIAVHGHQLVVAGSSIAEGRSVVLRVSLEGEVVWTSDFPTRSVVMPRLVKAGERLYLLWSPAEDRSRILIATIEGDVLRETAVLDLGDASFELRAAPAGERPAFLRTHGPDLQLELATFTDEGVTRADLPGAMHVVSPDICPMDDGYAVLFIERERRELILRRLDQQLRPIGEREVIARATDAKLHSARFFTGDRGCLAIAFRMLASSGNLVTIPSDDDTASRRERVSSAIDHVAAYDGRAGRLGPIHEMTEPGLRYDASGWLGEMLLLLTGEQGTVVARYRGIRS